MKNFELQPVCGSLGAASGAVTAVVLAVTVLLAGCAATGASTEATVDNADGVTFPALERSYLKTGDFVGPDHVRRVEQGVADGKWPGMNKDQVRLELGNPHFSEGIGNNAQWNYAFNLYTGQGKDYVTCQFQVRFNKEGRLLSTHWSRPQCAQLANPVVATVIPAPSATPRMPQRLTLSADGMFEFGKSGLQSLLPEGQRNLEQLAVQLKTGFKRVTAIIIAGHTDRIGAPTDNQVLSQARAQTVRDFLVQRDVDPKVMRAVGMGATQPAVQCEGSAVTPALVACLQPNRRVEIEVVGEK